MKSLFILCFIVPASFFFSAGCQSMNRPSCPAIDGPAPKTSDDYIERAGKFGDQTPPNVKCALDACEEAFYLDPKNPTALACRANFHRLNGEYDLGAADAGKLIEMAPEDYRGYAIRSLNYQEKVPNGGEGHEYTAAEKDLLNKAIADESMAIKRYPPSYLSLDWEYAKRGKLYFRTGDYDNAVKDYTEASRLKPDYNYYYSNRAEAYFAKGDNDNAIKDYTEGIRLDPNNGTTYYFRARVYRKLGQTALADADENKSKELDKAEKETKPGGSDDKPKLNPPATPKIIK